MVVSERKEADLAIGLSTFLAYFAAAAITSRPL
jgi:hypothetical protein